MNNSKKNDPRFWRKWYASGAVKQVLLIGNDLVISAVATFFGDPVKVYQTLSMGDRILNSGPDWSVSAPVCAIVVPNKGYRPGMRLPRLPGNAIPVDVFF